MIFDLKLYIFVQIQVELKICAEENHGMHLSVQKAINPQRMPPAKTPSPYVRRHDRINFVRTGSSSLLAAPA
jgi:hypothetical protein